MNQTAKSKINISKSQEQGAVMLLLVALIVVLLGVLGFAHFSTTQKIIKEELQTAADVASMAATKELCPSTACWDQARITALESLKTQTVRNYFGQAQPIIPEDTDVSTLTFSIDQDELQGYVTTINNIEIKIDRGHWVDLQNGNAEFNSLELSHDYRPWSQAFPGVPNWMTANGVNVAIVVPTTFDFLLSKDISGPIAVRAFAESTSVIGQGNIIADCVAPFAIPICALLDRNNQFDQNRNCNADRIFTRSDRYCADPNDADNCGIRPGFFYNFEQPVPVEVLNNVSSNDSSEEEDDDNGSGDRPTPVLTTTECQVNTKNPRPLAAYPWINQTNMPIGDTLKVDDAPITREDISTGWCNPTFDSVQDHYGVIGYLERDIQSTNKNINYNEQINLVVGRMRSCSSAQVGDRFKIVADGFENISSGLPANIELIVGQNMSKNTISNGTNAQLPRLPNPLLNPLPIEPAVDKINSSDIVPAGGYVLVSDLPVGPEPLPTIEESNETPTLMPTPTATPPQQPKKYCFSDTVVECPTILWTREYNCAACDCSVRSDSGLTSPPFYDNAIQATRTVPMTCQWEYDSSIDQCAPFQLGPDNDSDKCQMECGTYVCSPSAHSCNYYQKSGELACEVSEDCLRQCQEPLIENTPYPFPIDTDTTTESSEPNEDGKFQLNPEAIDPAPSDNIITATNIPNQLMRSSRNAGLCRSLRAELKCAQFPDDTPLPSLEFNNHEEELRKLDYSSAHYPQNVQLQSIPAPEASPVALADHACNLNRDNKFATYLSSLENNINMLKNYCLELGQNSSINCNLVDLEPVDLTQNLSPSTPNTDGIYANLKPALRAPQYQDGYWYTKIPIIADFNSSSDCSTDPAINPSGDWKIVGFIDGQIFDADVTGAVARDHWGQAFTEDQNSKNGPFPVLDRIDGEIKNGPEDWYFSTDGNDPDPCNLIRARMACQSSFVATPQDSFDAKKMPPVLRK
jgi:hypothetical protein